MDPIAEKYPSFSPYTYTLQNPVRYTDPTGTVVEEGKAVPPHEWNKKADGTLEWISGKGGNQTDYVNHLDENGDVVSTEKMSVKRNVISTSETSEMDFTFNKTPGSRDVIQGSGGAITPGHFEEFLPLPLLGKAFKLTKGLLGKTFSSVGIKITKSKFGHTFVNHGEDATKFLTKRAQGSEMMQGQFLNNQKAAQFINENLSKTANGAVNISIPKNFPARVIMPSGAYRNATHIRLVPGGGGVKQLTL